MKIECGWELYMTDLVVALTEVKGDKKLLNFWSGACGELAVVSLNVTDCYNDDPLANATEI
jgi:hypothetical protein